MITLFMEVHPNLNRLEILFDFVHHFFHGIEGFKFQNKLIGNGILIIIYLKAHPNANMGDIAQYLNITPSAATRRIDKLVQYKLIKRISDDDDRRAVKLTLSSIGDDLYSKFIQTRQKGAKQIFHHFQPEELDLFFKIMKRMTDIAPKEFAVD